MIDQKLVYQIILSTLNGEQRDIKELESVDLKELCTLFKEQALLSILYPVYKDQRFKKYYLNQAMFNDYLSQETKRILTKFDENSINYICLKGYVLKDMYPDTFLRSMGDVDILIPNDKRDIVKQIMLNDGYKSENDWIYDDAYTKNNLMYEMHFALTEDTKDEEESFFSSPFEYINNHELENTYQLVYLLYHYRKHLNTAGAGIRSVIDIMLFIKNRKINFDKLKEYLSILHYEKYFNTLIAFIDYAFNIKTIDYEKVEQDILNEFGDYILSCGIHGFGSNHNSDATQMAKTKKGKVSYAFSKAFPSYKKMKALYPYLRKLPFLLPFAYIQRLFHFLFIDRRRAKNVLVSSNNQVDKERKFKETIGLFNCKN